LSVQLNALDALTEAGAGPEQVRGELGRAHRLVSDGLAETARAVTALREDSPPLTGQLSALCEGWGARLNAAGTPRPLPAGKILALYRVAQEALTNAARHAPGAAASVELTFGTGEVTLSVSNPAAEGLRGPVAGSGYGIQGMRERILLLGGHLDAGPCSGGWQVTARVPARS
jgi:signal transduction histidine kinase